MKGSILGVCVVAAGVVLAGPALSQEHPEHPKSAEAKPAVMSMQALSAAIADYVKADARLKGGYFLVYDTQDAAPLALELVKVHEDRLARVESGRYFACADFKARDGRVYDLDIFMKQADHGLVTEEVTVHKVEGKARYGWKEEGGAWKRVAP